MSQPIVKVEGIAAVNATLRHFGNKTLAIELRQAAKQASQVVADEAERRVPVRSGRLRQSIRAAATTRGGVVKAGGARVPYAGWIEYGGTIKFKSRQGGIHRPRLKRGRYIRPAAEAKQLQIIATFELHVKEATHKFR